MSYQKKILIVDDSEMNRSLLSDILSNQFEIIEAENGAVAAAILHEQEYDISLMLLDIVMPVMDGFELLTLMNKTGWIKSIPVIMISSETAPSYVDRAYDLGVLDYINRPFDERTVQHRVISSIMLTAKQKELSQMLTEQIYEKEKNNRMLIGVLANLVEFRNGESGQHVLHIQTITELLLNSLLLHTDQYSISERDRWLICTASALHDMGKIMIPGSILNKPGRLTTEEFAVMKTHAAEGAKILDQIPMREREPLLQFAYQICRWHHERYDGRGYPDGLQGDQIPIAAQVVALADVYDALTSERVYKPAYSPEKAVQMILNGECGAFNPILLECLVDSADNLKKAITNSSLEKNSEQEILKTVEQMLRENQLHTSERSFRLLERERMKFQFLSELSQEITFEYTAAPEMVTLSRWGAGYLEMPEIMLNPRDSAFGTQLFQPAEFDHLVHSLVNTTQEEPTVEEVYLLNIRGEKRWCKVVARTIWLSEENVHFESAIGKITDVHDEMERMRRLERLAQSDPLTGLLNHDAARRRIESFLNQQGNEQYVLMFFDLDNFKQANDTRGHLFGNAVLKYVASVVKDHVRGEDTVARVGGDEFVVFMKYQGDPTALVERVFQAVSINYQDFQIRVSMGVALADAPGYNYKQLYQQADTAMYTIKNSSKNGYCFYTPAMKQQD